MLRVSGGKALCADAAAATTAGGGAATEIPLGELVAAARPGEPVYPCLAEMDRIARGGTDAPWHALIEADNAHALQFLQYVCGGKVDCIYVDPPYNTGARDWKYNNDYVDQNDAWRHSKWLSMMKRRLRLAKKLLNPKDSVLIVTIDEKEYLHLGCLLEEMFPEARIQMVSSVINPAGAGRQSDLARTDEYLFIVQIGDSTIVPESREVENVPIIWDSLRRSSLANARGVHGRGACGPSQFYPIYVNDETGRIVEIGEPVPEGVNRHSAPLKPGCTAVFPVRPDGTEMNWGIKPEEAKARLRKGYLRAGAHRPNEPQQYVISYVTGGNIVDIENGVAITDGFNADGSIRAFYPRGRAKMTTTNWNRVSHDAQRFGTNITKQMLGNRFPYPKSLYAVFDALKLFVAEKPDALIVDFFAGSGTTLHAVNLLNAEDGGRRRCIMVTNNEVSDAEATALSARGLHPGDEEWEALGIARHVTWPRTRCSIEGRNVRGEALEGSYGVETDDFEEDGDCVAMSRATGRPVRGKRYRKGKRQLYPKLAEMAMADGFQANAAFYRLSFLDKDSVALGKALEALLPTLWMKAGARGAPPGGGEGYGDTRLEAAPPRGGEPPILL